MKTTFTEVTALVFVLAAYAAIDAQLPAPVEVRNAHDAIEALAATHIVQP